MRVVSLNLDAADAATIRRALAGTVTACGCGDGADGRSCGDCEAIAAVVADLDRLLTRPAPRRAMPLVPGLFTAPLAADFATEAVTATAAAGQLGGFAPPSPKRDPAERRLWLVPATAADPRSR